MKKLMKKIQFNDSNLMRLFVMFVFVFLLMSLLKPDIFLRSWNLVSMMKQFPEYGIMAIGISLAMITGGIDLAVVGTANLSAIITAKFLIAMVPKGAPNSLVIPMLIAGIFIAVATGLVAGFVNGTLISRFHIPPILATLGTQQLFTGIAIVLTEGRPISGLPIMFSKIGNKTYAGFLPMPFIIFVIIAVVTGIMLSRTKLGKELFLVGTNPTASKFAGINNTAVLIKTYMISGVLSSFAGLIMMARVNSAKADYGSSYTLQCVLIAVLGGVNPMGGFGNIAGVTMAILILQVLSSGLNMFENVSNFYRDVIWGAVLILVLIMNYVINKRNVRKALEAKSEAAV
ncbi:MAG: ABC transporter permease [Spirochaetales bacterium]|nr:ABC transporter permease [Spirochaetales bacterium]